jgi:hypothetical protein
MRQTETKEVIICDACKKEVTDARKEWEIKSESYFSYLRSGSIKLVIQCSGDMEEICEDCANKSYTALTGDKPARRRKDE